MKIYKFIVILGVLLMLLYTSAYATITSCTLNNPSSAQYDNGTIRLNTTGVWSGAGNNITNVTWTIGTLTVTNFTVNGTGGLATATGDFTYTLTIAQLGEGARTVYTTCYNYTGNENGAATLGPVALNSTSVTYTIDRTPPSVNLQIPLIGSTVIPSNNIVTFEYIPTDTNFGNCTLHLNNQAVKSSSSGTTSPNVTTAVINRFTNSFGNDNNSIRLVIECIDLAGLKSRSVNGTFNTLIGSTPYAVKQQQVNIYEQQQGFSAAQAQISQTASEAQTNFQKYAWVYFIGAIVSVAIFYKKFLKR